MPKNRPLIHKSKWFLTKALQQFVEEGKCVYPHGGRIRDPHGKGRRASVWTYVCLLLSTSLHSFSIPILASSLPSLPPWTQLAGRWVQSLRQEQLHHNVSCLPGRLRKVKESQLWKNFVCLQFFGLFRCLDLTAYCQKRMWENCEVNLETHVCEMITVYFSRSFCRNGEMLSLHSEFLGSVLSLPLCDFGTCDFDLQFSFLRNGDNKHLSWFTNRVAVKFKWKTNYKIIWKLWSIT